MQMTTRQFPHPVVNTFDNGYKNALFTSTVSTISKNGDIVITVEFVLDCEYLQELLNINKAQYIIHLECKNSRYRKVISTTQSTIDFIIDSDKVRDEIELCILIVANEAIEDYYSEDFIDDFAGISFKITKGEILAFDTDKIITIEKDGDVSNLPSIFSITYTDKVFKDGLTWQSNGKKFIITLSKDTFKRYKQLGYIKEFRPMLATLIIMPVLTEIISEIKFESQEDLYTLSEEDECYGMIEKKLVDLGFDTPNKLKNKNSTSIANQVLKSILDNALIAIEDYVLKEDE